eukprot:Stramenopile-MAST_4_protein_5699
MGVQNEREFNTFLVTKGASYVTAVIDWRISLQVNLNDASIGKSSKVDEQCIAGPLTVSVLDAMWTGMLQNKKARKKCWVMDYFVCLNFLCSEWFGLRTHMAEEIFACSKEEWDLRAPELNNGMYIRDGIWFVREKHSDNTTSWSVYKLFTKQERKTHDFIKTTGSRDPERVTICIRDQWQTLAIKDCLGIVQVTELLSQAFRSFFGYPIGHEERNYSSNIRSSRGSKILLCHALPNPDFTKISKQFIQYKCDPHKLDCYVDVSNDEVLKQVEFKGGNASVKARAAMVKLDYEINGKKQTGVMLMKHPPSPRALHGVMKSSHAKGTTKLIRYAIDLVKQANITTLDRRLSTGKRFTSEEISSLVILATELMSNRGVKLDYRWFRRKHYAAKLLFVKKLVERELCDGHQFRNWVVQKYRRCIK